MHQEKATLRLINCLAGSFILHTFILSFSQQLFWNPVGSSASPGHPVLHKPLNVILAPKQLPSAIAPLPVVHDLADHSPILVTQQIAKTSATQPPASTKAPTPTYHAAQELSRMPEMIGQPPETIEIGQGTSGEVVFKLSIDRLGKVTLLQRLKSTIPRETEGKLAMQLYRAEYRAGEIDGIAVDSEMIVDLRVEPGGWITDKLPVLRQDKSPESP
jgi:hypothetical protein